MRLKEEVETLFRGLRGQTAWGAKVGWGSFVTVEFGRRSLQDRHFHGDWHVWLYQCDWTLKSKTHEMANSESKKGLMQAAVENLNGRQLLDTSFDPKRMGTTFTFEGNVVLRCEPYADAKPDEQCWMLFMPDNQVVTLDARGLTYEPASDNSRRKPEPSVQAAEAGRQVRFQD